MTTTPIRRLPEHVHESSLERYRDISTGRLDAERIYVPYFWYRASGDTPTPFGRRAFEVDCLVDALNGDAATCDRFALEEERVSKDALLQPRCAEAAARRSATQRVTHQIGRAVRTLADFGVVLEARGVVHKPYWLLRSVKGTLLVDGATGGWYPLHASATGS